MSSCWIDLYLDRDVSDLGLIEAGANAFDVPPTTIQVVESLTPTAPELWRFSTTKAMFRRDDTDGESESPIRFNVGLDGNASLHLVERLRQIARHLGVACVTDVETPECTDTQWRLVAPDGWSSIVTVEFDAFNRDAFVLIPGSRALLDAHTPPSPVPHAS